MVLMLLVLVVVLSVQVGKIYQVQKASLLPKKAVRRVGAVGPACLAPGADHDPSGRPPGWLAGGPDHGRGQVCPVC